MNNSIETNAAPKAVGHYPHARRVGNLLFLSGIGPRSAVDNSIPGNVHRDDYSLESYDISAQCHSVFANVKAVLKASGADFSVSVDSTVYLTNMAHYFKSYTQIWAEYFPDAAIAPCRTTLGITALPTPIAIELKCTAVLKD